MAREIKFRAWDEQFNTMRYHFMVGFNPEQKIDAGLLGGTSDENQRNGIVPFIGRWISEKDFKYFPLMQYTGIKDKNSVEIYEGDILLKHFDPSLYQDRPSEKGIVKWVDFGGRYTIETIEKFKTYHELYENLNNKEYPRSLLEVIGNIHQNPELLK